LFPMLLPMPLTMAFPMVFARQRQNDGISSPKSIQGIRSNQSDLFSAGYPSPNAIPKAMSSRLR
jgi:hypothetical protein